MSKTASLTDFGPPEPAGYILRFGKYSGQPITEVERGYLEWVLGNEDICAKRPGLDDAIRQEFVRRNAAVLSKPVERHTPPSEHDELTMDIARMIVDAGAEALKEQFGTELRFVAAFTFLKHKIALEAVNDGTLIL